MDTAIALATALAGAATYAAASVGQQLAAATAPSSDSLRPRLLIRLAHRREFLLGTAGLVGAYVLQAIALGFGTVALVEPIIATELVFAIPLAMRVHGERPSAHDWLGALAVTGGVAAFIVAAAPERAGHEVGAPTWSLSLGVCALLVALLVAAAARSDGRARAWLLAIGGGLTNGVTALVTKSFLDELDHGVVAVCSSWQPYMLIAVGAVGFLLGQSAFQAAPLADSLPILDAVEPVSAIVLAGFLLNEPIRNGVLELAFEAGGAGLVLIGVFVLGRSPVVLSIYERQRAAQERAAAELAEGT